MGSTLSVVIAARNCAERLEATVQPWRHLASEIIVADQMSTDGTAETAQRLGCRILRNDPPEGNFDLNRKLGMQQAKSDWILYIDTDERPTPELLTEVRQFLDKPLNESSPAGVRIPNRFYFLGRPLKHGLYDSNSAEIRMVQRDKWEYPCERGFHRGVSVRGPVIRFKNPYKHFNVNSIGEWFLKTNQYTEHDADKKFAALPEGKRRRYPIGRAFFRAARFFVKVFFLKQGFRDGAAGLLATFYFMLYHLTLEAKLWERSNLAGLKVEQDFLKPLESPRR